eukprot:SM002034S05859  [mRNA]  locus=s2034:715:1726:- [translate_table: standard]
MAGPYPPYLLTVAAAAAEAAPGAGGDDVPSGPAQHLRQLACGACVALAMASAAPSLAAAVSSASGSDCPAPAELGAPSQAASALGLRRLKLGDVACKPRLPPLSNDPNRCERAFDGNTIGQANGVADKVLDLRGCNYSGDKTNLKGKTLSAALMAGANFDDTDLTEVIMSKAYAVGASFRGANFTNAVVDRVLFDKADMRGAKFNNTVLSGSTFEGTNLEGTDFGEALIGYVDIQKICRNDTLPEDARAELGCK